MLVTPRPQGFSLFLFCLAMSFFCSKAKIFNSSQKRKKEQENTALCICLLCRIQNRVFQYLRLGTPVNIFFFAIFDAWCKVCVLWQKVSSGKNTHLYFFVRWAFIVQTLSKKGQRFQFCQHAHCLNARTHGHALLRVVSCC